MISRLFLALSALGLAAAAPLLAQSTVPPMPPVGAPKPFKVPAAETYRLANGLQVTLIPFGQVPKATISLRVFAGGLDEEGRTGLAALTSQMLREGAAGKSGADVAAAAADMGGSLGGGSGMHESTISLSVLGDRAGEAVQLIGEIARQPDFPAGEFDRVKQSYLRQIAVARSQPQVAADVALAAAYYGAGTPYGRLVPGDSQVAAYTLDDVRRFHAANFGAGRARIYVAGQFDRGEVKAAIDRAFGDWAKGPDRRRLAPQPQAGPRVILVDRPGATQSTVRLTFPAPVAGSSDDLPFRVTNALLGGAFTSRITTNIREQKGYTYSPGSGIAFNPGEANWTFNADVTTDVTGAALKEVFGEIRKLQSEAVPDEEGAGIRTWLAGIFVLQNASPGGLINSLATRDFHGLPADWLTTYVPNVLGVPNADLQRMARAQLPLERMTLVVVGDLAKVEPQLKALPELQAWTFQRVEPF